MKTTEQVPCVCGQGALEVEVKNFGRWRVERLLAPCAWCEHDDIVSARKAQPPQSEQPQSSAN